MLTIDMIMSAYLSDLAENKLVHNMGGTNSNTAHKLIYSSTD